MRVLLISTYELGHQPLHLASPAAALEAAGHRVRCIDLSVEQLDRDKIDWAEAVGVSVPMHTAMRLAIGAGEQIRAIRPRLPICFYGLYAAVSDDPTIGGLVDRLIAGEYEPELVEWVEALGDSPALRPATSSIDLGRHEFHTPSRGQLPPLKRYARLERDGEEQLAGYVEASHGCVHKCRHCPVPVAYDGRIRIVGSSVVMADIAQLVVAGARHITFGDPDFLNGVKHSLQVARELHRNFPEVTFDCTTKVEHILEHRQVWPELSEYGCLFVISAFESLNAEILTYLDKGHTADEAAQAVALLREHGIEIRPSWLPFTPWATPQDILEILDFVIANEMVGNVDPIQYTIRLL
ncbi:MAG: radical SAM protein, partial [Solirubrobacterales bacterium]